jgi:hypothetical protein
MLTEKERYYPPPHNTQMIFVNTGSGLNGSKRQVTSTPLARIFMHALSQRQGLKVVNV